MLFKQPDARWKALRKLSHRYLKQFGTGMSQLEGILVEASTYMLEEFEESKKGTPINTMETLKSAALSSIKVLLMGKTLTPEHALHKMLLKYERGYLGDTTVGDARHVSVHVSSTVAGLQGAERVRKVSGHVLAANYRNAE